MYFREFAERLLGSPVKIKLIRHLLSEQSLGSERETSNRIGASHSAVNRTLQEFHEMNLVSPMRIGNVKLWRLNRESYAYAKIASGGVFAANPLADLQKMVVPPLSSAKAVQKIVLFGSVADGREVPGSDIDLFVLVKDSKGKRAKEGVLEVADGLNQECLKLYGNPLSPLVMTIKDFQNSSDNLRDKINQGIVWWGPRL